MIHPFLCKLGGAFGLTLLVLALAGCGRFGPLEAPPSAANTSGDQVSTVVSPPAASVDAAASANPANLLAAPAKPATAVTLVPITKSFFLDPLVN